jgi:phenylacetaldehyde dehydrogenase
VLATAKQTVFGLAAAVWTRDISKAHILAFKLRAGTVWINCHNVFDAAMPFGGYRQSGWGTEMGHDVLKLHTEVKSIFTAL